MFKLALLKSHSIVNSNADNCYGLELVNEQWVSFQLKECQACALTTFRVATVQAGHAIFNHLQSHSTTRRTRFTPGFLL